MQKATTAIARIIRALYMIYARKWSFLAVFSVLFFSALISLARYDLLPEKVVVTEVVPTAKASPLVENSDVVRRKGAFPVSLAVPSRNISVTVANPTSTDIGVLDAALQNGVVRYPTSATLGEDGNVIIFGHSSYLPVVHNSAFKAFNGLEKVQRGDEIIVSAEDATYRYVVLSVGKESAESSVAIPLAVSGRLLTLATCDSFGKKSDRFVVTAVLVE